MINLPTTDGNARRGIEFLDQIMSNNHRSNDGTLYISALLFAVLSDFKDLNQYKTCIINDSQFIEIASISYDVRRDLGLFRTESQEKLANGEPTPSLLVVWCSKTELLLVKKLFKFDFNEEAWGFEIFYNSNFPKLLSGRADTSNDSAVKFIPVSDAPELIQKRLTHEVCKIIHRHLRDTDYELLVQTLAFESYFLDRLKELFIAEGYREYQSVYAAYNYLSMEKVIELAKLHAMIILILKFAKDHMRLDFIYDHLCECNYGVKIPLASFESFKKYLRGKGENLPQSIIHGLHYRSMSSSLYKPK